MSYSRPLAKNRGIACVQPTMARGRAEDKFLDVRLAHTSSALASYGESLARIQASYTPTHAQLAHAQLTQAQSSATLAHRQTLLTPRSTLNAPNARGMAFLLSGNMPTSSRVSPSSSR